MTTLEQSIEKAFGDVRLETLDISFGEFMSLYREMEFVIQPDFQRYFRWDEVQRSRLIESVILKLPIPQVFVVENDLGVLELIDGLQRISSVMQFVEPTLLNLEPLQLTGCDLVHELNGKSFDDLSITLKLQIKRAAVRTAVIKRQSTPILKYAMFKRLNTGGTDLSDQEIRNCTARMVGEKGARFYDFLMKLAKIESFARTTESLPDTFRDQRGDEELVLRFFALKNANMRFRGSVRAWLDGYMEEIILGNEAFDYGIEEAEFRRVFDFLDRVMGPDAFVRHRGTRPIGALSPALFEAISYGTWQSIDSVEPLSSEVVRIAIVETIETDEFKANVGPGSNSLTKFRGRSDTIRETLTGLPK